MRLSLLLLCCLCLQVFPQLQLSRTFPTPPRSIPLQILNCNASSFYFLRFNRLAHDITIEKRRKDDGSIAAFTPLKLDSVNANWFNYESLDYLFFEKQGRIFFVFERLQNNRSDIYMKEIDSSGRSTGFIELASLAVEKNEDRLDLRFELTEDKHLLITKVRTFDGNDYKQVLVIDPLTRKTIVSWKLPVENMVAGYSYNYAFDHAWNIYYVLLKFSEQLSEYPGHDELMRQRANVDSMCLTSFDREGRLRRRKPLPFKGPVRMHSIRCVSDTTRLAMHMMYSASDTQGEEGIYFAIWRFDIELDEVGYRQQRLREDIASRLTYYDGNEFDSPARKTFSPMNCITKGNTRYQQVERREDTYFKEVLIWRCDDGQDKIEVQQLIPRKIFFLADRCPYRSIGVLMQALYGQDLVSFVMEHPGNAKLDPLSYEYKNLDRQETFYGGNLVAYTINAQGTLSKKVIHSGNDYSCIPMIYSGSDERAVFYLVKGDLERFAILPLSQL